MSQLISVVVPCYRQAHFLAQAVESVLAQRYAPCELIVIDDGSPDAVASVLERFPASGTTVRRTWGSPQRETAGSR